MVVDIRPANPEEADALSDLAFRSKASWGYSVDFMEACRDELRVHPEGVHDGSFQYRVAELDGGVVGFYALARVSGSTVELEAMFVEPSHIGNGLGRLLLDHAKASASRTGATRLVIQGDPNAEGFYLAAGGSRIGERQSASVPGRYLPLFAIDLAIAPVR